MTVPRRFTYIRTLMTDLIRADRWRILPVILLAPFMGSLDGSIVNVAMPTIAHRLGVGMDGVQWVVSSYLIVISALVLIFGKVADKIGKVGIFEYGFLVFGAGSALCALSWSLPVLILARVFQAIGASMFMSSNQAIIATIFPHEERGRALGLLGTTVAIGTMVGPPLGGIMVDLFDWQSLFLINIPISIFAFVAGKEAAPQRGEGGLPRGLRPRRLGPLRRLHRRPLLFPAERPGKRMGRSGAGREPGRGGGYADCSSCCARGASRIP